MKHQAATAGGERMGVRFNVALDYSAISLEQLGCGNCDCNSQPQRGPRPDTSACGRTASRSSAPAAGSSTWWSSSPATPPGSPQSSTQDDDATASPQQQNDTAARAAESAPPQQTGTGNNDIVITGSRIARPEFAFPNPVQAYTAETMEQAGTTNLTDFLAESPALLNSSTSATNAGSNLVANEAAGAANDDFI